MAPLPLVLIPSLPYTRNVSYCLPTNCSIDLRIDFRGPRGLSLSLSLSLHWILPLGSNSQTPIDFCVCASLYSVVRLYLQSDGIQIGLV